MLILRIMVLKMVLQKYELCVKLIESSVIITLLEIINMYRLRLLVTNILKSL